ncbi:MAG: ornithine carbamoyltransferase, partial [Firmicutes bacterium HGW-Firmicutes-13]
MSLKGKDFLTLKDWSSSEIFQVIDLAQKLKKENKEGKFHPLLKGKTLGMIFQKASTRTRISFEVAMWQLGGYALFLNPQDLQIGRGEPVKDTARVLSRYLEGIMIRTFAHSEVEELAHYADIPVINGLTDSFHPCQALADILT